MTPTSDPPPEPAVVLFDGVCNLCNGAVQFVVKRDPRGRFRFAALQSRRAAEVLAAAGVHTPLPDSMVLVQDGVVSVRSTAALRIAKQLRAPWPLLSVFLLVPRPLRDLVYSFVAKRRYRWFGRRESCMVPTPELRARFLAEPAD